MGAQKSTEREKEQYIKQPMKAGDGTEGTSDATESEDKDGEATLRLSANPEQTHESPRDL